ncbi:hypothetical protein FAM21834_01574 [Lentilactobacillus parabuchneri]|jgi:hypothetical protein|uniref:Uncharacterized protein n=2 Tax=Lentilactobacillus parabuchneri TaxID=152331 RepID=A0A1X1FEL6_9LACO|nr:hypothetical protein [Lentilactobacillus parabuchneri]APR07690.1 hypothetical protein FAM21731_01516 [Lentilactobacillus parabuchneri]KRM44859.1 hypothetical protein FC51_GL001301 [Lentilactobacillus parabuchneri DSM 5707 = NBRC 107865]KRN79522.1 hypothetical protein IV42_GL001599 [Lentilactobacillus parabuchneri]MBW0223983.1 hypothetical protein [Lentilactobacillus parabuchneri]MBW0246789.1 hypothetical protein [Lentilactobacillus parabuchneri]
MRKIIKIISAITILVVLGVAASMMIHSASSSKNPVPTRKNSQGNKKAAPLTSDQLTHNSKLKYSSFIYFAIKYTKIQRWQEVSDFKLGWQIEIYPKASGTRYLVWPGKNIKANQKMLEPNWFKLSSKGHVIFYSFEVHTAQADNIQRYQTTEAHIIHTLNAHQHAGTVRKMTQNMKVVNQNDEPNH